MLIKLAGDLDEVAALHRFARFVTRMIAPDAEGHPVGCVGEGEFAVGFPLAGEPGGDRLELHVNARLERALRDRLADLFERLQIHRGDKFAQTAGAWTD